MARVLTVLHTGPVTVNLVGGLAKEILPQDVVIRHVMDDSLLVDTRKAGYMDKDVERRIVAYVQHAENYGSDCVLMACSSVGPAADTAQLIVNIPVLKIDEPMAQAAVRKGRRIAILATVATTLKPTGDLVQKAADEAGIPVSIEKRLCDAAFDALLTGDVEKHNSLLLGDIVAAAGSFDVVVLAQASMTNILPMIPDEISHKVLTSPRLGLERVASVLSGL